ncbi:MAG: hypothetical protein ABJ275_09220 [Maricaulaceae bacterium]
MKRFSTPLFFVWLLIAALYALSVWQNQVIQQHQTSHYNKSVTQSIIPQIHDGIKGIASQDDERQKQKQTNERIRLKKNERLEVFNHLAQINMAMAAWIGVLLGIFGSYLLLRTLLYTRAAANAANDTLDVARKNLNLSRDTAQKELRAYLSVEKVATDGKLQAQGIMRPAAPERPNFSPVDVIISFKNTGKTPANNVHCCFQWDIVEKGSGSWTMEIDEEKSQSLGSIGPSMTKFSKISIKRGDDIEWHHLQDGLVSGKDILYVYGKILYDDIYGDKHETRLMCYLSGGHLDGVGLYTSSENNEMI